MSFKVVHHLGEQVLAHPLKVYTSRDRRPSQMKMGNRLLKRRTPFELGCRLNCSGCLEPHPRSRELQDVSYQFAVVTLQDLKLKNWLFAARRNYWHHWLIKNSFLLLDYLLLYHF